MQCRRCLIISLLYWLCLLADGIVSSNQVFSYQYLYTSDKTKLSATHQYLPFSSRVSDILWDPNGYCFVAITENSRLYTSRRLFNVSEPTANRYSEFRFVVDVNEYIQSNPSSIDESETIERFTKAPDSIVIATTSRLLNLVMDFSCSTANIVVKAEYNSRRWGNVFSMKSSEWAVFFGTDIGVLQACFAEDNDEPWSIVPLEKYVPSSVMITSLEYAPSWQTLFVGSHEALYSLKFDDEYISQCTVVYPIFVRTEWIGAILDTPVLSMRFDDIGDTLYVVESNALHRLQSDGSWRREGYYQGAINANLTTIALVRMLIRQSTKQACTVLIGSAEFGLIQKSCLPTNSTFWDWKRFNGPRYLAPEGDVYITVSDYSILHYDNKVKKRPADYMSTVVVGTTGGLSFISFLPITLDEKERIIASSYSRHDRKGIVGKSYTINYGDFSTFYYIPIDTDSLTTSQDTVAAAMKYFVTKDKRDRDRAWKKFEVLETLALISGVPGLLAQTFCSAEESVGTTLTRECGAPEIDNWHASEYMKGWLWKGRSSSNTITGKNRGL